MRTSILELRRNVQGGRRSIATKELAREKEDINTARKLKQIFKFFQRSIVMMGALATLTALLQTRSKQETNKVIDESVNDISQMFWSKTELVQQLRCAQSENQASFLSSELEKITSLLAEKEKSLVRRMNEEVKCKFFLSLPHNMSMIDISSISKACWIQQIQYIKLINKNHSKNSIEYIKKVKIKILENLDNVRKALKIESLRVKSINQISLTSLGADPHQLAEEPVKVEINKDKSYSRFIYKPRGGETEQAILQLFKDLNELPEHQKTFTESLPLFRVFRFYPEGFVSEYVNGVPLEMSAYDDLQEIQRNQLLTQDEIVKASNNLKKLEWICSQIRVTDLHRSNVLFNMQTCEWIPVDLEVISTIAMPTGLGLNSSFMKESEKQRCTEAERNLINQFNENQFHRLSRLVSINTINLLRSSMLWYGYKETAQDLLRGANIIARPEDVARWVREDYENGDVPILYQMRGIVYYGNPERERILRRIEK